MQAGRRDCGLCYGISHGTACGDVRRKSDLRADEVSAEGVRLVGARSASLLAERADGCTSDMEVGEACSVRKMPENPVRGPTTSPYSSFRSWPKTPRMQNPGFMLKLKIETSRIRECRPVAAFPQICHAVNRTGTLHRQRGRGHNQFLNPKP